MLRRTKAEVEKTMPPKKEIHLFIGLTDLQIDIYKKLLKYLYFILKHFL